MEDASGDPLLEIDDQESSSDTKLPNAHSAALVMGFILLCVFSYCVYRIIKHRCCPESELSIEDDQKSSDTENAEENVMKQREDYLAIYGPKKNISSISGTIIKNERTELTVPSSR